jgi:hypothetical protein
VPLRSLVLRVSLGCVSLGLLASAAVPGDVAAPGAPPGGVVGGFEEDADEEPAAPTANAALRRPAAASPSRVDLLGPGTLAAVALAVVVLVARGRRR